MENVKFCSTLMYPRVNNTSNTTNTHLHTIIRPHFKFSTLSFDVHFDQGVQKCKIRCSAFSVISVREDGGLVRTVGFVLMILSPTHGLITNAQATFRNRNSIQYLLPAMESS